jgi:hypothetical protein
MIIQIPIDYRFDDTQLKITPPEKIIAIELIKNVAPIKSPEPIQPAPVKKIIKISKPILTKLPIAKTTLKENVKTTIPIDKKTQEPEKIEKITDSGSKLYSAKIQNKRQKIDKDFKDNTHIVKNYSHPLLGDIKKVRKETKEQIIIEVAEMRKQPIIMKIPSIFADKSTYMKYLDMENKLQCAIRIIQLNKKKGRKGRTNNRNNINLECTDQQLAIYKTTKNN